MSDSMVSIESISENSRGASPTIRKRRGRPPTAGQYIGLAQAKLALKEAEREEKRRTDEEEVVAASREARARAKKLNLPALPSEEEECQTTTCLSQVIEDNVGIIRRVAATSKNLKGGYVRALKDAASEISKVVLALQNRSTSDETRSLQADNARLHAEVAQLRKEMAEMRERLLRPIPQRETAPPIQPAPQPQQRDTEELVRTILCQVGTMMNARFEALEERLLPEKRLRPSLAADRRSAGTEASKTKRPTTRGQASDEACNEEVVEPQTLPEEEPLANQPGQTHNQLPWNVVVRKGLQKKKQGPLRTPTAAERVAKLNPPKSAAVVVTLTPEAIDKGITYNAVIAEAKAKIRLQDIGITNGVRFRVCATGARRFEIMGVDSGTQADALAEKLAQIFNRDTVRVSRPVKMTEVKISGLDDSISVDEVLDAVAEAGGCPKDSLKSSGVVKDTFGVGHSWVECPIAAAKRVAAAGRLSFSWVSASIKLLEPRPLRCYRCLQKGHVRAQCCADVDRSQECFRCGTVGHKYRECSAKPHCSICAAAKKPADHQLGGKACSTPAPKIIRRKTVPPVLQANINHCARAQDLLLQSMAEWSSHVAVVAEPYLIPNRDNWTGDEEELVALVLSRTSGSLTFGNVKKGRGCVVASVGGILMVGVYCPPRKSLSDFEDLLSQIGTLVGGNSRFVLIAGDFNAKNVAWGCPTTDARGAVLEEWALTEGLCLLNQGSRPTCVRPQGSSIVDLSFASPAIARRVYGWKVLENVETMSDHLYIRFHISESSVVPARPGSRLMNDSSPRWVVKRINKDIHTEASQVENWMPLDSVVSVDEGAYALRQSITRVCNASMPRQGPQPPKKQVYWWSVEIAELRTACVTARRQYQRVRRRRRRDEATELLLRNAYTATRRTLCLAISEAKESAREEMIESLNRDPWGRPYRMVRGKLRSRTSPLTQSLHPQVVTEVVRGLFPQKEHHNPPTMSTSARSETTGVVEDIPPITSGEFGAAIRRLNAKKTAPGPDGIPGRAWVLAADAYEERVLELMNACLSQGRFPQLWKNGTLVLLRKEGRPENAPSGYRPIVLLDEVAKMFEHIVAKRLTNHMTGSGPDLDDSQFGFRAGRSTVDAIVRVKKIAEEAAAQGEIVLAVSLDIANAFNTLPWSCIREALRYHRVPGYLQRIVADYTGQHEI
ncbi:uncharacterized protein LOC123722921 [Papilio machaon]|uniref:uncharacterized protein LOC123722921 n=1 Tax=Papilio machaon TaxID=76193 RepID=UPI001E6651AD|nr:uncharacterized protein LOC123722921 [Papilio machaon]